ncbi:unnamed protein product [Paramecium pentaurelia]|uniref:Uncharacterized protein n=1 Tax=Paramecium pentaurelia TaxID=43138 RepID=A0A8S1YB74_9CILI|nr:unnamed protein product [Paramecium pentaurelia]
MVPNGLSILVFCNVSLLQFHWHQQNYRKLCEFYNCHKRQMMVQNLLIAQTIMYRQYLIINSSIWIFKNNYLKYYINFSQNICAISYNQSIWHINYIEFNQAQIHNPLFVWIQAAISDLRISITSIHSYLLWTLRVDKSEDSN